ncbi:MAG TPA: undecaprenyl-phosphate galactose phosphotransferase WbaP [Rhizomicrobium sp.]|nr:undecaprenyl-phosphate galactose phosphotransferase WbaP [Rhizomicrobium sp.]
MTTTWINESWQASTAAAARARHARYWASVFGLALADGVSFLLAYIFFRHGRAVPSIVMFNGNNPADRSAPIDLFAILALIFIAVRYLSGDYNRRQLFWDGAKVTTIALIITSLVDFLMLVAGRGLYAALPLLLSWSFLLIFLPLMRQGARAVMTGLNIWQIPTTIIGVNGRTTEVCEALRHSLALGFDVRWLVVENPQASIPDSLNGLRMLHSSDATNIASAMWQAGCKEAIVTAEDSQSSLFAEVIQRLFEVNIPVAIIPSLSRLPLAGVSTNYFFGRDILLMQARSNVQRLPWRLTKRLFDIVVSLVLLVVFTPLFLVIAVVIKRTDPGGVTYSQTRIGRQGRPFSCIKFRTMVSDADARLRAWQKENPALYEEFLKTYKLRDDPRITPIGRWLRKTSLDELPQLINVLRGEMSLVGPRPVVLKELQDYYGPATQLYIRTRPGITGLWQVSGRSDTTYERRIILDEWYILNWSFWYDIVIMIQTAWIVITGKGAV